MHYHFIKEKVLCGDIEVKYINTEGEVADIFTKGLSGPNFEGYRRQLGMITRSTLRKNVVEGKC